MSPWSLRVRHPKPAVAAEPWSSGFRFKPTRVKDARSSAFRRLGSKPCKLYRVQGPHGSTDLAEIHSQGLAVLGFGSEGLTFRV